MNRGRTASISLLAAAALAAATGASGGRDAALPPDPRTASYLIIVNPESPVRELGRSFVRDAFLKKAATWADGETIRPVDLPRVSLVRERFTREVLNKTPAQLRAYWNQQIFSGKGVPPPEVDSDAAMIAYVLHHHGAMGYLPRSADPRGAVVVRLR